MHIPEINEVKAKLESLTNDGLISDWELPYENLLTRLSAAIFFITPTDEQNLSPIWAELNDKDHFSYRLNQEQKLSKLRYRITFSSEEKNANEQKAVEKVGE